MGSWTTPSGIAHGTGIGIGLFLLLIATNGVGMVIKNEGAGLPVQLGEVTAFPVIMTVLGLAAIFGLERRKVPGGILMAGSSPSPSWASSSTRK